MKDIKYLIIVFVVTFVLSAFYKGRGDKPVSLKKYSDYSQEWKKIDSLEMQNLPKSALLLVDKIYKSAKKEHNYNQIIKTFIYKAKLKDSFQENALEKAIDDLQTEIKNSKYPEKQIFYSMLGEMYWHYYKIHRWQFSNRSNTESGKDIKTWSLNKLLANTVKSYTASLQNADSLQRTSLEYFNVLLTSDTVFKELRPTLYDFLAERAVDFFENTEININNTKETFELNDAGFFAGATEFVKVKLNANDTLNIQYNGIKILRNWLNFRIEEKNKQLLADVYLKSLKFVYKNSTNVNRDSLYINALKQMYKNYKSIPYSANIAFEIANFYQKQAYKYNPSDSLTYKYKTYNRTAFHYFDEASRKYPKYFAGQNCKQAKENMLIKELRLSSQRYVPADSKFAVLLEYRNIDSLKIQLFKVKFSDYLNLTKDYYANDLYETLIKKAKQIDSFSQVIPYQDDLNKHFSELVLNPLETGLYILKVKSANQKLPVAYQIINVTNISYSKNEVNKETDFYVINRKTGKFMPNVKAKVYQTSYFRGEKNRRLLKTVSSDKNGFFRIITTQNKYYNRYDIQFYTKNDTLLPENFYLSNYGNNSQVRTSNYIFTDRAIYRPGQTVYFKIISVNKNKKNITANTNSLVTVIFKDAHYKKISELKLQTNDFGTCNGSFQIPDNTLNGNFSIYTSNGTKTIKVEEYKRPTFKVAFEKSNKLFKLNDSVKVKINAKTFSGVALNDAKLKYKIYRISSRYFWRYNRTQTLIESGKVALNSKGQAVIKFKAVGDKYQKTHYTYKIVADVSDINGETHSAQKYISVGETSLFLNVYVDDVLIKENFDSLFVSAKNIEGKAVDLNGKLEIYRLEPKTYLRKRIWHQPDVFLYSEQEWKKIFPGNEYFSNTKQKQIEKVYSSSIKLNESIAINTLKTLPSGDYSLNVQVKDSLGKVHKFTKKLTLLSLKSKNPANNSILIFKLDKTSYQPGDTAKILFSSSKKINALYQLSQNDSLIERYKIHLNNEQKIIEIPIKEAYRGNVSVNIFFVYDNRVYTSSAIVKVPFLNKKLNVKFLSFRDKAKPGSKEKFTLQILNYKNKPEKTELLACMYDKSLDKIRPNSWRLNIFPFNYYRNTWKIPTFSTYSAFTKQQPKTYNFKKITYPRFNWFGFYTHSYFTPNFSYDMLSEAAPSPAPRAKKAANKSARSLGVSSSQAQANKQDKGLDENISEEKDDIVIDYRKNFSETAFFYPDLQTDANGNVNIEFTYPDALTTWRFMGLAITKDLKNVYFDKEIVTQKELMITANKPRFFRWNDSLLFVAKISNLSDTTVEASYKIEFFDLQTEKKLELNILSNRKINIPAKESRTVTASLFIPEGLSAVKYRISADCKNYSDAEEGIIPVVSNRMLVTQTMPLWIKPNESKSFNFDLLSNNKSETLQNFRYTVEFTSNPVWYAIQALPYLMEYPYECAEQTFSRYYANTLATKIVNSSEKIKQVFEQWRNAGVSKSTLSSALKRNPELKNILLEETPWVLNAEDEEQQKANLALLFDLNRMSYEQQKSLKKLFDMQYTDGSWPWFSSMPSDRYITQHIVTGFGHLQKLKAVNLNSLYRAKLNKSLFYLDAEINKDYKYLLKHYSKDEMKKDHISYFQISYLYMRSFYAGVPVSEDNTEAYNYYLNQAKKYWTSKDIRSQALTALVLYRSQLPENKKIAEQIIKSLKERMLVDEYKGAYWKDNRSGYLWNQAAIETQALMIEMFAEITKDTNIVEELKKWLLSQKRTQHWNTTKATVDAVYSLILTGKNTLQNNKALTVKVGNIQISPSKISTQEAGTGYFKYSFDKNEISPELAKISVKNNNDNMAWGSIYWQYFEDIDKVKSSTTELAISKQLFVEKVSKQGKKYIPVDAGNVKLGDKILVKLTISASQTMNYVHIKDSRASGLEPVKQVSEYLYKDGLSYYISNRDVSTEIFITYLHKGTYVIEYLLTANNAGNFASGISSIECMYAPEFKANSGGVGVRVN